MPQGSDTRPRHVLRPPASAPSCATCAPSGASPRPAWGPRPASTAPMSAPSSGPPSAPHGTWSNAATGPSGPAGCSWPCGPRPTPSGRPGRPRPRADPPTDDADGRERVGGRDRGRHRRPSPPATCPAGAGPTPSPRRWSRRWRWPGGSRPATWDRGPWPGSSGRWRRLRGAGAATPPEVLIPAVRAQRGYVGRLLDAAGSPWAGGAGCWSPPAGCRCELARLHFDAGERAAAEANRDAAIRLARQAGDAELAACAVEALASWALADGRWRDALELARAGQDLAPPASVAALQLALDEAQAWTSLGDPVAGRRGPPAGRPHPGHAPRGRVPPPRGTAPPAAAAS